MGAIDTYPCVIIGGGITGIGIFRDLALHRVPSLILNKGSFCSQTSSRSSKMLHGGIRYLEYFDFALVREALQEKNIWTRLTPHLAYEKAFTLPIYKHSKFPLWMLRLGLFTYDYLSDFQNKPYSILNKKKTLKQFPHLEPKDLCGAGVYYDAIVDDKELGIQCLQDGLKHLPESRALEHVEVISINPNAYGPNNCLHEVIFHDQGSQGAVKKVYTKNVVIACGPFTDEFMNQEGLKWCGWQNRILPSKGIHLWIDAKAMPIPGPLVLQTNDMRIIFAIPNKDNDKVLVGTTETFPRKDLYDIVPNSGEVNYLLQNINEYFPSLKLSKEHIVGEFAGIRPLVREPGKSNKETSREHEVVMIHPSMWVIMGGKYTTFRTMGQEITESITHRYGKSYSRSKSITPFL